MTRTINKLLIANRGEIAVRIARTAARMGIETVAVFSDADADAPHARAADEAIHIGPAASAESYLSFERLLHAAERTGADAIHPGFGFLAENAAFAEAVEAAGLVFVGPSADAIREMGSKQRAKAVADEAGVPTIPGYDGADQDPAVLAAEAKKLGFPVLVKASAGGGGKGMRIVREEAELAAAIEGAAREAQKSFGDGTLILETYVERPRHVEIQIMGDAHGEVVHLWERECSIQRRHQKIIEEAPSPALSRELRAVMGACAIKLAQAIGYRGAGTVEMILDEEGAFYFLEVNTRLQVEHPVTEAISDLDLVELQLRVARGEPLPLDQEMVDTLMSGHAIECRVYAEDPAQDFLPQSGPVLDWWTPSVDWLRVDTGVETGSEVSIHYDPMMAKIIAWGITRADAIDRMRWALRRTSVLGLTTNRDYLLDVLATPAFLSGDLSTHFVAEHAPTASPVPDAIADRAAAAVTLAAWSARRAHAPLPTMRSGFRNNRAARQEASYTVSSASGEREVRVSYIDEGAGLRLWIGDDEEGRQARVLEHEGAALRFSLGGRRESARLAQRAGRHHVSLAGRLVLLEEVARFPDLGAASAADGAIAPMPGQVVKVSVALGDEVSEGQTLLVMEAMKMEHSIRAPHDGVVAELSVAEGDQVDEGQLLVLVKEPGEAPEEA